MHPAGVNDIIKEHATLLKDATGFRVLIPDLYKGKIGVDKEEAHHVSSSCIRSYYTCCPVQDQVANACA
jgi:hypothetical protein